MSAPLVFPALERVKLPDRMPLEIETINVTEEVLMSG